MTQAKVDLSVNSMQISKKHSHAIVVNFTQPIPSNTNVKI